MGYGTIRISDAARDALRGLARAEGKSMLALVDEAVEALRRQRFLEQVNAAYAVLREDRAAWSDIERERGAWDTALTDGLVAAEGKAPYASARPVGRARGTRRTRS